MLLPNIECRNKNALSGIVVRAFGANLSSFIFLFLPGPSAQFGGQCWPGALIYSTPMSSAAQVCAQPQAKPGETDCPAGPTKLIRFLSGADFLLAEIQALWLENF